MADMDPWLHYAHFAAASDKRIFLCLCITIILYGWHLVLWLWIQMPVEHQFLVPSVLMICKGWALTVVCYFLTVYVRHKFVGTHSCEYLGMNLWMHLMKDLTVHSDHRVYTLFTVLLYFLFVWMLSTKHMTWGLCSVVGFDISSFEPYVLLPYC